MVQEPLFSFNLAFELFHVRCADSISSEINTYQLTTWNMLE